MLVYKVESARELYHRLDLAWSKGRTAVIVQIHGEAPAQ